MLKTDIDDSFGAHTTAAASPLVKGEGMAEAATGPLRDVATCVMTIFGASRVLLRRDDGTVIATAVADVAAPGARRNTQEDPLVRESLTGADGRGVGVIEIFGGRAGPAKAGAMTLRSLCRIAGAVLEQAQAAQAATKLFEGVFAESPSPSWIYDPVTLRFLQVNEAAIRFYGYPRDHFMRMNILDLRPVEERQKLLDWIRDRPEYDPTTLHWRHMKANGERAEVITHGRNIIFNGIEAVIVVIIDRTDVLTLRDDLSNAQNLLDTIIAALPVGLFVKDMQDSGRYLLFNPAMEKITGQGARHVIGQLDHQIFGAEEGGMIVAQDGEVMTTRRQHVYEADSKVSGRNRRVRTVKKPLATPGDTSRYLLGIAEDVTESHAFQNRIAYMALHDALTDLPNRVKFQQHVDTLIKRAKTPGSFALFYLDLDFFKTINDTYGHPVGDTLLKEVARRLKSNIRRGDLVARLGGDEFAIAARISNGDAEALGIADRILKGFDIPFELGECLAHVGTSIGIALSNGPGQDSGQALMRHADIALYAAKAEGRGLAKVYADRMSHSVEARQMMSEDLRMAIAEDQFELDYQPLHDLASERINGFEALIRWRHPKRGLIPPGDFIPVAEQTGLIVPIGEWVLREACRTASTWPENIKIAVNLSAVQFKKPGLEVMIERNLAATGLSARRLELEITESVLLTDSGANLQILHRLRAIGVRIAMDDFGTGYSSLSYLRSFPFDKIKMDRSFVADLFESNGSLAIVRAVTGLGSSLSITTTAEGVETAAQFARLKAEGFDELQGYFISRPVSPDRARLLATSQAHGTAEASAA